MAEPAKFNLDNLMIAAPCPVSWDDMSGDERVRHCAECKLNVFKIDEMSTTEVELLLSTDAARAGKVCVQLYRRADGTVLTKDCPKGLARIREFSTRIKRAVAVAFAVLISGGAASAQKGGSEQIKPGDKPATPPEGMRLGGAICPVPPPKKDPKTGEVVKEPDTSKKTPAVTKKENTTTGESTDESKKKKADNGSLDHFKQGQHFEHSKEFTKAVDEYQKGLSSLPPSGFDPKFQLKIETALSRVRAKVGMKQ